MERSVCNRNCWISGAIAGVVVLLFTSGIGDLAWGAGLLVVGPVLGFASWHAYRSALQALPAEPQAF